MGVWDRFVSNVMILEQLKSAKKPSILLVRKAPQGILGPKGHLGIFPASFNPPTKAHVALIREARKQTHLDEILVVLDLQAMDKKLIGATWEDRIAMMEVLFRKDPMISIGLSNRGLFLDKLEPLKRLYPSPIEFTFIVGFDTLIRILDKKYYKNRKRSLDELFEQSQFLVANRDEYEERVFEILFRKRENKRYREKMTYFSLPKRFGCLSSSLVRKRIIEGRSVGEWVPAGIARFIKETGLYAEKRR